MRQEPAKSTLRHGFFKTVKGVGQPEVWREVLNQSAEIKEFWCSNSAWSGVMAVTLHVRWIVDYRVIQLVVERMKIELSGCVHCLDLKCDQEQPKNARRNPSVGFCTRGRGHIRVSAHRLGVNARVCQEGCRNAIQIYFPPVLCWTGTDHCRVWDQRWLNSADAFGAGYHLTVPPGQGIQTAIILALMGPAPQTINISPFQGLNRSSSAGKGALFLMLTRMGGRRTIADKTSNRSAAV
jgi:hypothetical protein